MEIFRDWIINIITIMVISVFVEIIMPDKEIKKYAKLVMGLIVMIIIIQPLIHLSESEGIMNEWLIKSYSSFEQKDLYLQRESILSKQKEQIIRSYRDKLSNQIKEDIKHMKQAYKAEVNVDINEDLESSEFGFIKNLNIVLIEEKKHSESIEPVKNIEIETVRVDSGQSQTVVKAEDNFQNYYVPYEKEEKQLAEKIMDELQKKYDIPKENIKIYFQKS